MAGSRVDAVLLHADGRAALELALVSYAHVKIHTRQVPLRPKTERLESDSVLRRAEFVEDVGDSSRCVCSAGVFAAAKIRFLRLVCMKRA